jgi:hypothetical protein
MTDQVEALLREYTTKLRAVFRGQLEDDVTAAVRKAISGSNGPVRRGRPPGAAARVNEAPRQTKPTRGRKSRGGKRSPEQMAKLSARLLAYIAEHPGQRSEQISAATKLATGDLALPLRKLVAEKRIKSSGVARGTTYTLAK